MRPFLIIAGSLLLSLTVSVAASTLGILLMALLWGAFDICTAFGGTMEGSCGYAFMFFFMPITVLACLFFVTIFAYRQIQPWVVHRFGR